MLAVRIPDEMESRLDKLAALTGRSKSYYVRQALQTHLDEIEETYTALYRLEHPAKRWTLTELEQRVTEAALLQTSTFAKVLQSTEALCSAETGRSM